MEVRKVTQPKANEVLLRVGSCCLSHYDFDFLTRFQGRDRSYDKTLVLGSFGTGIVLEVGSEAQGMFNVGDRVAFEPGIYCRKCNLCVAGKTNLCPHIRYLGTEGLDGLLCRFVIHPAHFIQKLPPGVSLDVGTLATKIAGCIHGYHRSGITKESKILIMGTSLIGLLAIMIFKHLGVGSIFVAEMNNHKLKMARDVGADYVIKLTSHYSPEYPEYLKQIIHSTNSEEPDIVIDTWGTSSSIDNALNLIKSGGRLVLMNRMNRPVQTKLYHTTLREIDLVGAYSYTHSSFVEGLNLLSNQNIPLKKILPVKIPLERAMDAFSHGRATAGENLFILVNSYNEEEKISENISSSEKTASIPNLKPESQIPEPTKGAPTNKESSSTVSEAEKRSEEMKKTLPISTQQTEKLVEHAKDKVTSTSSIDDKKNEETKKEKGNEVILRPKSADENENQKAKVPSTSSIDDKKNEETKKEKGNEVILRPKSADENENQNAKVPSTSSIDDKKNEETKKEKGNEVILRPKSAEENQTQPGPQDKERKQDTSLDKKDEKKDKKE